MASRPTARPVGRRDVVAGAAFGVSSLVLPAAARATSGVTPIPTYAGGTVDGTFNPGLDAITYRVVADGDDILVGGAFTTVDRDTQPALARLRVTGARRTDFNPVITGGNVRAIARRPDGTILIGGDFTDVGGASQARIARLAADGTRDATFTATVGDGVVWDIALEPDGSAVIVGNFTSVTTSVGTFTRNGIARLSSTGSLDEDFDPDMTGSVLYSIARQSDGKLLVGGTFTGIGGGLRTNLARLAVDGTLDDTFTPPALNDYVSCILLDDDDIPVASGRFDIAGASGVMRLTTSGSLDPAFGVDANNSVWRIALQRDGGIVLCGFFASVNTVSRSRLARVASDGTLDGTFDPGPNDTVRDALPLDDGSIIVVGQFTNIDDASRARIARLI